MQQQLSIYIIEDEPLMAKLLKHIVYNLGHVVCGTAESYDEAVADLNDIKADLVITDIMLRGNKTGIDVGRYIGKHLNIPFVYQSSITDESMISDAWSTSPISYLQKPVNRDSLSNALSIYHDSLV